MGIVSWLLGHRVREPSDDQARAAATTIEPPSTKRPLPMPASPMPAMRWPPGLSAQARGKLAAIGLHAEGPRTGLGAQDGVAGKIDARTVCVRGDFYQFWIEVELDTPRAMDGVSIRTSNYHWNERNSEGFELAHESGLVFIAQDRSAAELAVTWLGADAMRLMTGVSAAVPYEIRERMVRTYSLDRDAVSEHLLAVDPRLDRIHDLIKVAVAVEAGSGG